MANFEEPSKESRDKRGVLDPPVQQAQATSASVAAPHAHRESGAGIPPLRTGAEIPELRDTPAQDPAVQAHAMLRIFRGYSEPTEEKPALPPDGLQPQRLHTGQDARAVVLPWLGGSYQVAYRSGAGKDGVDVVVATFRAAQREGADKAPLHQLPLHIDDFTQGEESLIRIKYDPERVQIDGLDGRSNFQGHRIRVEATPLPPEELMVRKGPAAIDVGGGFKANGPETILNHQSTREDHIVGAIAEAEGGFATVEASDAGVFTWGQGQWTVTGGGELQQLLAFIKERRADLFDRYWRAAGLDVKGRVGSAVFVYHGKEVRGDDALEKTIFRPSKEQNRFWTTLFGQAGMDPQIQRLQREFLRREVSETISEPVRSKDGKRRLVPHDWLNERGLSLYYSAKKNLPSSAEEYLAEAVNKIAPGKLPEQIDDSIREQISNHYEERFKDSPVVAWQWKSVPGKKEKQKDYALGFWGEQGRKAAVERDEVHIQESAGDARQVQKWTSHRDYLAKKRASRYESTVSSMKQVKAAPNEPELPEDVAGQFASEDKETE